MHAPEHPLSVRVGVRARRALEFVPGVLTWSAFAFAVVASIFWPVGAAVYIIVFDLYWLLKAVNSAMHLLTAYRRHVNERAVDWLSYLRALPDLEILRRRLKVQAESVSDPDQRRFWRREIRRIDRLRRDGVRPQYDWSKLIQLIIIPFVHEGREILEPTLRSLAAATYPKENMFVVLAAEERAGADSLKLAETLATEFRDAYGEILVTVHPDGLEGEIKGKSANATWAAQAAQRLLDQRDIPYDHVIVSNFDSDTVVDPRYFARVAFAYCTEAEPQKRSYQPIAVFNNNIWDAPAVIRLVAVTSSFWQFIEASRPDRLRTFSSHSMSFATLVDVGFWAKDVVNEDSFIYWQCFRHFHGDYAVVPLFLTVSMDTVLAPGYGESLRNQYRQKRRWAFGVEYFPWIADRVLTDSDIPLRLRLWRVFQYLEGHFHWATAPIMITLLGWLPLFFGRGTFSGSVLAFNLPWATQVLMTSATAFLIFSVVLNFLLLPPRPARYGRGRSLAMLAQWFLVPIASMIWGSLPAIDAQTRLMLGRYLGFWVTPKARVNAPSVPARSSV